MNKNNIQEVIRLSIEGGYKKKGCRFEDIDKLGMFCSKENEVLWVPKETLFLDPLFWHCLGKSLGWKDIWEIEYRKESGYIETWERPEWHYWQYKFIDHLAENKDPGLFFEKLLK